MDSPQLIEYLRTGTIRPLDKGDTKFQVEQKIGPPERWKGQMPDLAWSGPEILNFRDSFTWHYGSLSILFPEPTESRLPGICLNYYTEVLGPVRFVPPFTDLPALSFTTSDLIEMLDRYEVQFEDVRPDRNLGAVLISEGGVAALTLGGNCSPKAQITYLLPHDFKGT